MSNPIEELDDVAVLVIILLVLGGLIWGGFQLKKLLGGGDGKKPSLPTFEKGNAPDNSPATPVNPERSLLDYVDPVTPMYVRLYEWWESLFTPLSNWAAQQPQTNQSGDAGQWVDSYNPLATAADVPGTVVGTAQ